MRARYSCFVPAALAAAIGVSPALAQQGEDASVSRRAVAATTGSLIVLPGGATIHAAQRPVVNTRAVAIPGSTAVLALWEEVEANGSRIPHYAFSLDGSTLSGRARETTYTIRLRYAEFDPMVNPPVIEEGLFAAVENNIYLVQFWAPPIPVVQEAVQAAGGEIVRFMQDHTCVVRMDAAARDRVAALDVVRWVGENHTAYKIDPAIVADLRAGSLEDGAGVRYSIECFDRGAAAQQAVADRVAALGGIVEVMTPDQFRMEATLTPAQLLQVADMNQVYYIDPWGGPGGTDMNIVRAIGGANFIETTLNYTGQGVRGEVFDTEVRTTHQEFTTITPVSHSGTFGNAGDPHGSSVFSIVFARGASANARGLLPNAGEGYFYHYPASTQFGGAQTRLAANQQLVNPALAYQCVFQTSSVGSAQTTVYTSVSAEVDDYLYQTGLLSCQSQSNTNNQNSRPQAWAKNIVSGGAFNHLNTLTRADDTRGNASIGPAADARIKPDLCFFYDSTFAASNTSNTSYTEFGGTSGATPSIAGHFGLFFQMWHEGVWAGRGGGSSVFNSRAKMMTAKAALVNTAFRYTWTAGGPNASITRNVQGWGMPDLQNLYNLRNKTVIVDEDDAILPLGIKTYNVNVAAGEPVLAVTMAYKDRAGPTSATQHRINDLSLRVVSPGGTTYWGNNGLTAGNFSTSGGVSNVKDTVENVFVQNPQAGVWQIIIEGDEILQDTRPSTPAIDADYGLWATGCTRVVDGPGAGPFAYTVQSNGNQRLYRINLSNGVATDLGGPLSFTDAEGVTFGPNGDLFAIGGSQAALWNISTAPGTLVANLAARNGSDAGLDYFNGSFYNLNGAIGASTLYRINPSNGAITTIGSNSVFFDNLAINDIGQAFAVDSITTDSLYSINLSNGAATLIGPLNIGNISLQFGLSFSSDNKLYAIGSDGRIFRINTSTGAATFVAQTTIGGANASGFEGLAIDKLSALARMPLPSQSGTFSGTTRGYWFTAPYNGEIRGLRVPDPTATGTQNVEVVRLNAAPPAFPAVTNNFVSLGRFVNVPGTNIIACSIPVGQGDIIGILGSAGPGAFNSYGTATGGLPSNIKGLPVTLRRLGMQFNVATTPAQDLWTEDSAISRVELYYTDGRDNLYLSGDQPAAGSNLTAAPLVSPVGTTTWTNGELFPNGGGDAEFIEAGAHGNCFDGLGTPANCHFDFNFDVETVTMIYGGNSGGITIEARNAANVVVDTFTQLDTFAGQPAGPITLSAPGIRRLRWIEAVSGSFAAIDNVKIKAAGASCYANCDGSTAIPVLNVNDFVCFQQRFAAGDPYANCDGSTTAPVLNVNDFVCFQQRFAAGCP